MVKTTVAAFGVIPRSFTSLNAMLSATTEALLLGSCAFAMMMIEPLTSEALDNFGIWFEISNWKKMMIHPKTIADQFLLLLF